VYDYVRMLGYDPSSPENQYADFEFLWGDIYWDDSPSRVLIADSEDYYFLNHSSEIHYEMQKPLSWGNGEILVEISQGTFQEDRPYFLFVIDENNNISSPYTVTFNGSPLN